MIEYPPLTTDREGRGCDWREGGREKTQPDKGTRPPLPTDREGFREE
jgi:hypothetical protein